MNTTEINGSWNEQQSKLAQKFAVFSEDDLLLDISRQDEMFGNLQLKLEKTKEKLDEISAGLKNINLLIEEFK